MKHLNVLLVSAGLLVSSAALVGCGSDSKAADKASVASTKLWDRLGGDKNVRAVVDDFVGRAAKDPEVNFFRANVPGYPKWEPTDAQVANLKQRLVELISANTQGPYKYGGKEMKPSHAGMKITNAQFNKLAFHLDAALKAGKAADADRIAVMGVAESTRKDIVEVP